MESQDQWNFRQDNALALVFSSTINAPDEDCTVTGSAPSFSLLRHWLQDCVRNHLSCAKSEQTWPTRLLYIGSSNSSTLRLVENEAEKIKLADGHSYAALSHCWGQPSREEKEGSCLFDENRYRRLDGFSMTEMPKTFRDAVQVTRSLGLSLLWIDALCINQTDPEAPGSDWITEAARMQDVFSSAVLTISATSATDWKQGFCESASNSSRQEELSEHVKSGIQRLNSRVTEKFTPLQDNDFKEKVDASELNQRAWVLQERVLSRRIIHFAKDSTYWECGKLVRCDDFRELRW